MKDQSPPTFGVEEEFLLLDPHNGRPVPKAPRVLRLLRGQPGPRAELMRYQVEVATRVCATTDELRAELRRLREIASDAARSCGCRLVASGTSPYPAPGLSALTENPRYRELARRYPVLTAVSGTCACHVHVGVPSRDTGVQVLNRLRPWLATLLALSANSPLEEGRDTGWASRRYPALARWPTGRPPSIWPDAAAYDRALHRLIERGAALDEGSVYWLARLSPRYPTVEVRVADVCPDIDTAVLVAVLVRGLVATCIAESRSGEPVPSVDGTTVRTSLQAAARYGLAGYAIDPWTGLRTDPWHLVNRLADQIGPTLASLGDERTARRLLRVVAGRGAGAERQRKAWNRASSPADLVAELTTTTWTTDPRQHGPRDPMIQDHSVHHHAAGR
ncbi:carboxylate-amine ligase [Paractinoplanes hotanensis]|uniref:Putative glutamate--cysteine ligase 2 n=1 Tax=Paractinoplanes hotanensis TaxID=2906497 RepID=A0ABT0Y5F2_9ACTN|nr:glutamate--cysteine ligase [Actinoplanes hotanensis]MCM4081271.1 glutamate--cysteine ligase [Actinoplanes hotanensis]